MKTTRIMALALTAGLFACDARPFGPEQPSFLLADLEGEVETEYRGSGDFARGHHTFAPVVSVASRGDPPNDRERIGFSFYGPGRSERDPLTSYRPGTGVYPLSAVSWESEPTNATAATYGRSAEDGTLVDRYIAVSGEVVITRSRSKRLEGHFTFEAVRFPPEMVYPHDIDMSGPRITVTGSFGANWYDPVVNLH